MITTHIHLLSAEIAFDGFMPLAAFVHEADAQAALAHINDYLSREPTFGGYVKGDTDEVYKTRLSEFREVSSQWEGSAPYDLPADACEYSVARIPLNPAPR